MIGLGWGMTKDRSEELHLSPGGGGGSCSGRRHWWFGPRLERRREQVVVGLGHK